jgi:hypothetical protein
MILSDHLKTILNNVAVLILFTDKQIEPETEKKVCLKIRAASAILQDCIEILRKGGNQ